jgi:hypothetical protein
MKEVGQDKLDLINLVQNRNQRADSCEQSNGSLSSAKGREFLE